MSRLIAILLLICLLRIYLILRKANLMHLVCYQIIVIVVRVSLRIITVINPMILMFKLTWTLSRITGIGIIYNNNICLFIPIFYYSCLSILNCVILSLVLLPLFHEIPNKYYNDDNTKDRAKHWGNNRCKPTWVLYLR